MSTPPRCKENLEIITMVSFGIFWFLGGFAGIALWLTPLRGTLEEINVKRMSGDLPILTKEELAHMRQRAIALTVISLAGLVTGIATGSDKMIKKFCK